MFPGRQIGPSPGWSKWIFVVHPGALEGYILGTHWGPIFFGWKRVYKSIVNPKYDGYQTGLASIVNKFFDKKTGSGASVNEGLAQELHKPKIKKFERWRVYARFKDNISTADLAGMRSLSSKVEVLNICYV